jgi:dTDP-4-dehydrorhamnose reductase
MQPSVLVVVLWERTMRIAITGASGQLGRAFQVAFAEHHTIIPLGHTDLELSDPHCVDTLVGTQADLILHPAAYTNVDGCARDPEKAYRTNGLGTRYVAIAAQRLNATLVYISTNEVFDGHGTRPYWEYDTANPVNPYGHSKYIGEQAVRELVEKHYITRVAWLYGGERNFVRTVLRLANERPSLSMVADEVGSPTHTGDVAEAIGKLIETQHYGTYHIVNEGHCSRYDLASEALRLAGRSDFVLNPIALADYPRPGVVPPYTPLANIAAANLGIRLRPWQDALAAFVDEIRMS